MGSLFNTGNEVINALLDCSEDSYIKSLQDLVNHIVKPDKLYLYHTGDKELWKFANTSEGEKLDVEYAIPNKKVKFSEEVVNEVNFILKLVKNNMKLVPGGTQMRFLIAADPDGVDPDGVGPSIRGGVDIGGKRRRSGEEKTKAEKGERKAQGSAIPTDKGNDDSKADKEQAVVLKGSAGEGGKDKKPAGRVDDQEGVGGQRKRKTRGRPKGKGKEAMADKEQEVETIGAELEEVPVGVRKNGATGADESGRGGEDQEEVVGRTGKEDKTGTWREKELKRITPGSTEISKISTSQREGDGERRAPRKVGATGADESDHGERDEDQDAAAKRIKTEKTGTGTESTESTDYAYEYVNLVDGSSDTELPTLIEREKEKRKRLEKEIEAYNNATFQERILFRNFIMDRNLKSDPPENIKLIYEMPPWKQVKGGRRQQFTRTMSEQEKNWIGDTIYKLVYRSSWKFSPEERVLNEAIMNQLKREGYLKDYNLGFVSYGSLKPGEWLSAEVINSQGKLFSKREVLDKGNQSRFLIFNTLVYEMAHKSLFTNDHHTVRDWPTFYSIHSDLLDDDVININNSGSFGNRKYLIFPVGNGSHFMLLIFNIRKWQLLVLDSLHPPDTKFQRQAAYLVITMVKSMLYLRDPTLLKPHKEVACYAPTSGPKQQDYCSCGVFCILFMDAFTKGMNLSSLKWSSSFIKETRMRFAAELLKGELYD